jgi:hypothetical protein
LEPLTIDSMASPSLTPVPEEMLHASRPWLALALTFLFLGIGYGLPFQLAPAAPAGLWQGTIAPEVLNLYALTVFGGWGHFVYAWRGQFQGTARLPRGWRAGYWLAVAACIGLLILFRSLLGVALFSGIVWVWFIAHFVKAELVFAGSNVRGSGDARMEQPSVSWQPVAAFAWLSLVLFNVAGIQEHRWLLFSGCTVLGVLILLTGGWRRLAQGSSFLPALALFFDGEAFVWGTYGQYMHPMFRIGVYVFHVAGASFFHYLGSYAYGHARSSRDRWLRPIQVAALNLAIIAICCTAAWLPSLRVFSPLLGLEWFTLWVAAHLAASDLLPIWKKLARSSALPASAAQ